MGNREVMTVVDRMTTDEVDDIDVYLASGIRVLKFQAEIPGNERELLFVLLTKEKYESLLLRLSRLEEKVDRMTCGTS